MTVQYNALLEFLEEPRYIHDAALKFRINDGLANWFIQSLAKKGRVLVSDRRVAQCWLNGNGGGREFRKGRLYVARDSPLLSVGGVAAVKVRRLERFTLRESTGQINVRFIEKTGPLMVARVGRGKVYDFVSERRAVRVDVVAEHFNVDKRLVSGILNDLVADGRIVRRGMYSPRLEREVKFKFGFVYAVNAEEAERFLESGEALSGDMNVVLNELEKFSRLKRFLPTSILRISPYNWDMSRVEYTVSCCLRTFHWIRKEIIVQNMFLYDSRELSEEDVGKQREYYGRKIGEQRLLKNVFGHFHEAYIQQVLEMADRSGDINVSYNFSRVWDNRKKTWRHTVRLSNNYEIDRVLNVEIRIPNRDGRFDVVQDVQIPIDFKYQIGGMRPEQVQEFYDKLRTSREFGTEVELTEANQKLRVRILKAHVVPVIVTPFIQESARKLARQLGVNVIVSWAFEKYIQMKAGKEMTLRKLFKALQKEEGKTFEQFLTERITTRC